MTLQEQNWEKQFDEEFFDSNLGWVSLHDTDPGSVKDFISSLLEEQKKEHLNYVRKLGDVLISRGVKVTDLTDPNVVLDALLEQVIEDIPDRPVCTSADHEWGEASNKVSELKQSLRAKYLNKEDNG